MDGVILNCGSLTGGAKGVYCNAPAAFRLRRSVICNNNSTTSSENGSNIHIVGTPNSVWPDISIDDCEIFGGGFNGIHVEDTFQLRITNSRIHDNGLAVGTSQIGSGILLGTLESQPTLE